MNNKIIFPFIVSFCVLYTGCHESVIPDKFEPVLECYREDPVERDAAKFLLGNIKYHRSFAPDPYGSYCDEVDSIFVSYDNDSLMALALEKVRDKYDGKLRIESDTNLLTPDYLIRDIDSCVHDWQTLPWLKNLSKDDFYEYYLPYKCVEGQLIDDWRESADLSGKGDMPILNLEENAFVTARARYRAVHEYLQSQNMMNGPEPPLDYFALRPDAMSHYHGTNCFGRSYAEMMFFRANKIPVATEYTPSWVGHDEAHSWVALIGGQSADQGMEPWTVNYDPGYFKDNSFVPSKVYRMGWSPREILVRAMKEGVTLPGGLSHLFVKDVTDQYNKTADISAKCRKFSGYVFLSVFNGTGWIEVDISRCNFWKARFRKVTRGVVYCITSEEGEQLSSPFYLDPERKTEYFHLGKDKADIKLTRKYPLGRQTFKIKDKIAGATVYTSMDGKSFDKSGRIDPDKIVAQKSEIMSGNPVRYIKIIPDNPEGIDLAEIYFYGENGQQIEVQAGGKLHDDDPLTYGTIGKEGLVIDLGREYNLGHISVIKRGDGNDVVPGHKYELLYNDGSRWAVLDRRKAEDIEISFSKVPEGVPLWIKDISGGKENALFIVINGKLQCL